MVKARAPGRTCVAGSLPIRLVNQTASGALQPSANLLSPLSKTAQVRRRNGPHVSVSSSPLKQATSEQFCSASGLAQVYLENLAVALPPGPLNVENEKM